MTKMRTVDAAVAILEKEGATEAFGLPGAAINPFYSAMRAHGGIRHTLARHVEGASHMADGYSRAKDGNIGICIGTSGPAGTDMITGLYAAWADSIPMLCITGQAPVAKLHKEDFQAVDIESIAKPVTKMAMTILEPGQVPGAFQKAFQLMRSGRPGPVLLDLPIDVQMAELEFDIDTYEPLAVEKPRASRKQLEKALDMLTSAQHPLIVAGGGIINAGASAQLVELAELLSVPVIPTLMGWGAIPDDHRLMAGMVGLQTSHRYGNETYLQSDFVIGIGNRWANRHTGGLDTYTAGRKFVHIDIEPTQIGRVFSPDLGIASDAGAALDGLIELARERLDAKTLPDYSAWVAECTDRKATLHRKTHFENIPLKPQRVYEEMNRSFGQDTTYVSTIGLSQIAGAQMLHVFGPRKWINAGQAGPLGWTAPAALGVVRGKPDETVVALSGDYDFQFMIEELAVGAQFNLPYIHVVVNNSYLGLIRQSQRGFNMEQNVSLAFDNINSTGLSANAAGYGVDHIKVAEGLGCKAIRVEDPNDLGAAFDKAKALMGEFKVPVVVEVILEKVTNISMGTEINAVNEFEDLALTREDAPTAILALQT
jgi:tartronate-semialdehyde synthase